MAFAAILSSCEDPSSIGLELDPNLNQIGVSYIEIPLSSSVVLLDTVSTTNTGVLLYGYEQDDFFGKTEAIGYTRLFFNREIAPPKEKAVLDSVKFNISFSDVMASGFDSPKTINIHLLKEQIRDVNYLNSDSIEYEPSPSFRVVVDFRAKRDTIVNFKVDNATTRRIFEELKRGNITSDIFAFREFLPGLAFKGEEGENSIFTTRIGNSTGMIFYFKNEGDTVSRAYPIASGVNFNLARHFNQVKTDASGTPTEVISTPRVEYNLGQYSGGKSLRGLVVKLITTPLDGFLDTLENVTFNQVILELGIKPRSIDVRRPPQFHLMYFTNETNEILKRLDGFPMAVLADGTIQFDPVTGEPFFPSSNPSSWRPALLAADIQRKVYSQIITSHLNSVYRKQIPRRDFLLYPGSPGIDEMVFSLRDYVIDNREVKLRIFYSRTRIL